MKNFNDIEKCFILYFMLNKMEYKIVYEAVGTV